MKTTKLLLRLVVLSIIFIFSSCSNDGILMDDLSSNLSEKGGKKTVPETTVGNNLSFPVIWSDGISKELRGTPETITELEGSWWGVWGEDPIDPQAILYSCGPYIGEASPCAEAIYRAYIQKDAKNTWQASNWVPDSPIDVDLIDWGDNLESIDWSINSQVRTEVVLYKDLETAVTEYAMRHCNSWGIDEVHGLQTDMDKNPVTGLEGQGMRATVYTPNARLTIQKLHVENLSQIEGKLNWLPRIGWTEQGGVSEDLVNDKPLFNMVINDAGDGPGFYNAEVNVKGKVIYGYTWNVRKDNEDAGYYRITFSFDNETNLNTFFVDGITDILLPIEEPEEIIALSEEDGETSKGGFAIIDYDNNLTYMDILIIGKTTGNGGGNGGGSGSGGGTGHGNR